MGNDGMREVTITRTVNAPLDKVWKAWTDQETVRRWWGPRGVTNPTCEWNAAPDGKIEIVMLAGKELGPAAGQKWPMRGTFREVTPQRRLVIAGEAIDDVKNVLIQNVITVDFESDGDKVRMTVHVVVTNADPKAEQMLQGMGAGFNQQTDKLVELLEKKE